MKKTLSAKALKVLRAIARGRPKAMATYLLGRERQILTIGNYMIYARSVAAFRSAACDNANDRVVMEIFPGFAGNEALGFDLDGKVWIALQDESNDWAEPLKAKYFGRIPGMNPMVSHLLVMVELLLLSLTAAQIKDLNAEMRKTYEPVRAFSLRGASPQSSNAPRRRRGTDEDIPF